MVIVFGPLSVGVFLADYVCYNRSTYRTYMLEKKISPHDGRYVMENWHCSGTYVFAIGLCVAADIAAPPFFPCI